MERTERVKNCQDPEFSTKLHVDYHFEKVQKLKFGIYDIDNKSVDLKDDDFLGGFECTLGQVFIVKCCTEMHIFLCDCVCCDQAVLILVDFIK